LQLLRQMLALVVDDLPPVAKPASFEAEGALLRAALAKPLPNRGAASPSWKPPSRALSRGRRWGQFLLSVRP
jgi:hypothetical protein